MPLIYGDRSSAGPSRKRSYAQITKSESPDPYIGPPIKRRRTAPNPSSQSPSSTSTSQSIPPRFVGDGLDFRRPTMSAYNYSGSQSQTIDLTLDSDDSSPERGAETSPNRQIGVARLSGNVFRSPPFIVTSAHPEVIDLSTLDDEDQPDQNTSISIESSPELEIIEERVRTPVNLPPSRFPSRRLPTPIPATHSLATLQNIVRGATQAIFGSLRLDRDHNGRARGGSLPGQRITYDPAANLAIYEDVDLDYGVAAFEMGLHEEPQPQAQPDSTYKAPPPAKEGFIRTYDEEDVLVCGLCGDELAMGDDEIKAQVWVVKQCGHLYCGTCAHGRALSRGGGTKDRKRTPIKKPPFKICAIPGCGKTVDSKTKMFQIYL